MFEGQVKDLDFKHNSSYRRDKSVTLGSSASTYGQMAKAAGLAYTWQREAQGDLVFSKSPKLKITVSVAAVLGGPGYIMKIGI